jgi:hypothetical protein
MKRVLFFITLYFTALNVWATPSLLAPRKSIVLQSSTTGSEIDFMSDGFTYLKVESSPQEMAENPKWFTEVRMMTKSGEVVGNTKYKTSKKTLFQNVGLSLPPSQAVIDTHNKDNVLADNNLKFIVEGRYVKNGWDFLQIYFVDSDGNIVDHKGQKPPHSPFRYYRLSTQIFDYHMAEGMIKSLDSLNEDPLETFYCPKTFSDPDFSLTSAPITSPRPKLRPKQTSSAPKTSLRPKLRPKREEETIITQSSTKSASDKSTYETLMEKRGWFLKTYPKYGQCLKALRNYEKDRKGNIWGTDISMKKRAEKIYAQSKNTFNKIISHEDVTKKRNTNTGYSETHNPHMIHPQLSPELMTCIAFQETKGTLDPQAINYSYCEKRDPMRSTAFGLAMLTRSTMSDLRYYKPHGKVVNQLPITTVNNVNGRRLSENMSLNNMTYALSDSVEVQMELMARTLNYTLKHYNWQKKLKSSSSDTLKWGVLKYDGDDQEKYLRNVVNTCLPCMNKIKQNGGSPLSCHDKMGK